MHYDNIQKRVNSLNKNISERERERERKRVRQTERRGGFSFFHLLHNCKEENSLCTLRCNVTRQAMVWFIISKTMSHYINKQSLSTDRDI